MRGYRSTPPTARGPRAAAPRFCRCRLGLRACVRARRLLDGEPGARVELLAVAARRSDPSRGRPAVAHRIARDRDLRARREVALANAGARQRARAFGLEPPRRDVALVV